MATKTILVLQRGWVVIGELSENETRVRLENASVIRRWGTNAGILAAISMRVADSS